MALNDDISESLVARSIMLDRFSASERRRLLRLHRELEFDLRNQLHEIDPAGVRGAARQKARAEKLLKQSTETIRASYREIRDASRTGLYRLAKEEASWFLKTANTQIGANFLTTELSAHQLRAIVSDTLIEGAPSKEWWGRQAENLRQKFEGEVRTGMMLGKTTDEIVRDVRGTEEAGFRDGIMETSRRQAEALVRSSVQAVANEARETLYEENQDIIKGVTWLSTLDSRTTIQCMALNGLTWLLPDHEPLDHDQPWPGRPPIHWNCRSTVVSVFKSFSEIAKQEIKTEAGGHANAQEVFERNLREQGLPEDRIAKAVVNAKASMDGQVPRELTFSQFLEGKSKAFQDDLLGPGRADLWREGKLTLPQMIDQSARPLTLEELRRKSS